MLTGIFDRMSKLFEEFDTEMRSLDFTDVSVNGIRVRIANGHVEITGQIQSLTMNGRQVRFKEPKC